jgi:fructan beta-fructosidase
MKKAALFATCIFVGVFVGCGPRVDILIADFEGPSYGSWQVEGEAFGPGPAKGTLPDQMAVSGYEGEGLVNTYYHGDGTTGTLHSESFEIERKYINFLIGGGKNPGETCMNLLIDERIVRTATGPNDRPGGSEELHWESWEVSEYIGRTAKIEIVDEHTGGWGHINVDHIYQSDVRAVSVSSVSGKERSFRLTKKYLNFPVDNSAEQRLVSLIIDGKVLREFEISLAGGREDYWVFLDVSEFKGERALLKIQRYDSVKATGFDKVFQADSFPGQDEVYTEKLRPQFHFSSRRGWNNDTNGMVYYDGEYHMFYQHNPFGWPWGNMTWGHAVSTDMIYWKELGDAIHPDELGTIFSGGAVVDKNNSADFKTGDEDVIVCFYTSAGGTNPWSEKEPFTQSIAYSNDRGRTFSKYEGNPIIGHIRGGNRDPKVIWHEPTQRWVMVLYVEESDMDFFTSTDLKNWTKTSRLKSFHECPELFELPVDGDENNKKWVIYGAAADYFIGSFDGKEFKAETKGITFNHGNAFYASQTFSDIPEEDGRRIMMGWGQVPMPDMPWNQMITFPLVLSLRTTDEGIRMFAEPVEEVEKLHKKKHSWKNETITGSKTLNGINGELFHIKAQFEVGDAESFGIIVREYNITYDTKNNHIVCTGPKNEIGSEGFYEPHSASLKPIEGKIILEVLVDRTYVEVFANNGRYYFPMGAYLVDKDPAIKVFSKGGKTEVNSIEVYELESIWR